jgi:hypothetical protein
MIVAFFQNFHYTVLYVCVCVFDDVCVCESVFCESVLFMLSIIVPSSRKLLSWVKMNENSNLSSFFCYFFISLRNNLINTQLGTLVPIATPTTPTTVAPSPRPDLEASNLINNIPQLVDGPTVSGCNQVHYVVI